MLLAMIVMVGWQMAFPPPEPGAPTPSAVAPGDEPVADVVAEDGGRDDSADPTPVDPDRGPPSVRADSAVYRLGCGAGAVGTEERRVRLEGDGFEAALSTRGARLVSYRLSDHLAEDGEPMNLVRRRTGDLYPLDLVDTSGTELPVGDALYDVVEGEDPEGRPRVLFCYDGPLGSVAKEITLLPEGLLQLRVASSTEGWALAIGPGVRNPSAEEMDARLQRRLGIYKTSEDVEEINPDKTDEPVVIPGVGLDWAALEDTYFLTAIVPRSEVDRVTFLPLLVTPGAEGGAVDLDAMPAQGLSDEQEDLHRELLLTVRPEGEMLDSLAYFGAKDYTRLSAFPWGLEETVDFGFFGFLAKGLLVGLKWIYQNVVPNYGWAIVLMTVLIKLLLLPLTHTSMKSMQKMQELAPKQKEIRNRYKGKLKDKKGRPDLDQQRKMNEELQALFKKEGVNPLGGCLPMLLQFPVLLAFYNLLLNAVELRGAPWIAWIDDLSKYDPYFVLPIVMGSVQFLQQRMAPAIGEPMQRRIMMLMPVFFTVLFLKFPSGLVLYWLTNTVLTAIQQTVYRQTKDDDSKAT